MNDKPKDPLYPKGFGEEPESANQEDLPKPTKKDDDLTPLEKLNRKIGVYLSPSSVDMNNEEKKRKIGVIITTIIILTLIISMYYFLISIYLFLLYQALVVANRFFSACGLLSSCGR